MRAPLIPDARRAFKAAWAREMLRRKRRPDPDGEPVAPLPDRPLNLSGGGAAALEFDD